MTMDNSASPHAGSGNEREISPSRKPDCYFYYYSSCNKGNACPFRHEPAALRNETMCIYWLKGSCIKPHCIYRHMEITKKRDKIPCFFESQPGGCKKLHCPFLHNNVLDRPRDEDVPKNPDLILPVKDSEAEYENEQSEMRKLQECVSAQLKLHRKLSQNQRQNSEDREGSPEVQLPCITRQSFIVPLQDGESDSESVCVSPTKMPKRHCIVSEAESEWELERLKQIQKEEGNLLGYSFATDEDEEVEELREPYSISPATHSPPYYEEVEEFVETYDQDPMGETIVRRRFHRAEPESYIKRVLGSSLRKIEPMGRQFPSVDMNKKDNCVTAARGRSPTKAPVLPISERLGPKKETQKPSVKERLGATKKVYEEDPDSENGLRRKHFLNKELSPQKKMVAKEGLNVSLSPKANGIKNRLTLSEDKPARISRGDDFEIKSLAYIKAEKEQGNQNTKSMVRKNPELLPLSALINKNKEPHRDVITDIGNIKVKTLAEIKAEKGKVTRNNNTPVQEIKATKRPISPISFDSDPSKKAKSTKQIVTNGETKRTTVLNSHFSPRKLTLKKSKPSEKEDKEIKLSVDANRQTTKPCNPPESASNTSNATVQKSTGQSRKKPTKLNSNQGNQALISSGKQENNSIKASGEKNVSRLDSFVDEEELLLGVDMTVSEDEDLDEDELLL